MKLVRTTGWTGKEERISGNATEQEIAELLSSLDWQEFNAVRLEKNSQNWIEVSGNLSPDGLAIVYEKSGV